MLDDIKSLNSKEKMFLAGCLKRMVLANSFISEQEVDDLGGNDPKTPFINYGHYLTKFEDRVKTEEDFWNYAKKITNSKSQDIILKNLYKMSLEDGYMSSSEAHFYRQLEKLWLQKK